MGHYIDFTPCDRAIMDSAPGFWSAAPACYWQSSHSRTWRQPRHWSSHPDNPQQPREAEQRDRVHLRGGGSIPTSSALHKVLPLRGGSRGNLQIGNNI